jgi:hypothetical protein
MIGTPSGLRPGGIIHGADNDTRGFDWAADPKDFVVRVLVANRHYSMPVSRPARLWACGVAQAPSHAAQDGAVFAWPRGPFGKTDRGLLGRRCAQDMPARVQDHDQPGIEFIDRFDAGVTAGIEACALSPPRLLVKH